MNTFEERLQASARRLKAKDNNRLHVPENPLKQRRTYWGWVATPAAAVAGLIFGLSVPTFLDKEPEIKYVYETDTLCVDRPVHDTLYLTQVVEREKYIIKHEADSDSTEPAPVQESDPSACTSVECDGINYSILALN